MFVETVLTKILGKGRIGSQKMMFLDIAFVFFLIASYPFIAYLRVSQFCMYTLLFTFYSIISFSAFFNSKLSGWFNLNEFYE